MIFIEMIPLGSLIEDSEASQEAKRRGLKHVGWGKYADASGKVVAKSENGKLVMLNTTSVPTKNRRRNPNLPKREEKKIHSVVEKVPTKKSPSFDELSIVSKQHTFTINSRKPIGKVIDSTPEQELTHKPRGIWFAIKDSWVDWLSHEMPKWKGDYLYSVDVDVSKCLTIKDEYDMVTFIGKYGKTRQGWNIRSESEWEDANIDWRLVSKDYSGIIIPKYMGEFRHNMLWYYSWDVASGCIWDVSAIKSVKQVPIQ